MSNVPNVHPCIYGRPSGARRPQSNIQSSFGSNPGALAMYQKANPDTRFVELRGALPNAEVAAHEGPGYVIAVYEDDAARTAVTQGNPYVLPMTRDAYERAQPATYQAFSTKQDAAWQHVNPELMQELTAYKYEGFWVGVDTFKDKEYIDTLYSDGDTPWQVWKQP